MNIGLDHSIFMILLVFRHLDCIFHYSLSGRRNRELTTGGVETRSEEIAVGRIVRVKLGKIQDHTVFALCSDKLDS